MENSEKILFGLVGDDKPQWYLALASKWVGPMTASDIYRKIQAHEITWAHFIWKKGQSEWKRICDVKPFQATVPRQPAKEVQKEVKEIAAPAQKGVHSRGVPKKSLQKSEEIRSWYLFYNSGQFGPFFVEEILHFLKIGKIHGQVHGWREGMKNWERLERLDVFRKAIQSEPPAEMRKEQRVHPRRPLIARILLTDEQSVIVGVCRDISIGGLQVLSGKIPAEVGSKLKMNISPSTNDLGKRIEPFVAEGVIVRILEDGRGFSFRFERLSEEAKLAIETYIES